MNTTDWLQLISLVLLFAILTDAVARRLERRP